MSYLISLSKFVMKKTMKNVLSLGKSWIHAMETNLSSMEENLNGADKLKHQR